MTFWLPFQECFRDTHRPIFSIRNFANKYEENSQQLTGKESSESNWNPSTFAFRIAFRNRTTDSRKSMSHNKRKLLRRSQCRSFGVEMDAAIFIAMHRAHLEESEQGSPNPHGDRHPVPGSTSQTQALQFSVDPAPSCLAQNDVAPWRARPRGVSNHLPPVAFLARDEAFRSEVSTEMISLSR
jgi:hypothetical protein